ncbi:MAG: ABC-F family ATP-binding cassette domain-containing protein [Acidimicrobiales bacterium]
MVERRELPRRPQPTPLLHRVEGIPIALRVSNLRIEIAARVLLDDATFQLEAGEKVALVGPNGAGKTTLLRTLAGELTAAGGTVTAPVHRGWLEQDAAPRPEVGHLLTYDYLLSASPLTATRNELADVQEWIDKAGVAGDDDDLHRAVARFGELEEQFRLGGGYEMESTAERVASGLGLDDDALLLEVSALSGGQRRRLELARLIVGGGELLVLDEPTNHLDAEAKAYVMNFLRTTASAVLLVSHDIALMSESVDRVLALEGGRLEIYKGTYTEFLTKRAEREEARASQTATAEKEIVRLQRTADRFRQGNASAAGRRRALEQRITRIGEQQARRLPTVRRRVMKVRFPIPERAGDIVLTVAGLAKGFDGETVFADLDFTVDRGEVFVVVGANGAGKTTLLRTIVGIYRADAGEARLGARVNLGFYAQEHEDIPPGATVLELMQLVAAPGVTITELRAMLGHFGLFGDVADQEAATLSGGEKTKLSLARLVAGKANVLLLDEPTNNLDTASREAVLAALQHFRGTVVLVSHDLDFVTQLAPKHAILMPEGKVLPFDERMLDLVPQTQPLARRVG